MSKCDFIEYSNNYSKPTGSLWQYYRGDPHATIVNSESLKFKIKIRKIHADGNAKNVKISVQY